MRVIIYANHEVFPKLVFSLQIFLEGTFCSLINAALENLNFIVEHETNLECAN